MGESGQGVAVGVAAGVAVGTGARVSGGTAVGVRDGGCDVDVASGPLSQAARAAVATSIATTKQRILNWDPFNQTTYVDWLTDRGLQFYHLRGQRNRLGTKGF